MVEFKFKNPDGNIYRLSIRTGEIREIIEMAEGKTKIRLTELGLNGERMFAIVENSYDDVKKTIEEEQGKHLSRLKKE